jgi:hypothetical protein
LKCVFPDINPAFLFKGQLLNEGNTIDFYKLKSNDSIVAIPAHSDPCITQRWIAITRDCDAFSNAINVLVNPGARREFLRLRDLRSARIEGRRRTFRTMRSEKIGAVISRDAMAMVVDKADLMSEDPLPICW